MNAVQRLLASRLMKRRILIRFQSNDRPTVPLGSRILTDPAKVYEHNMWDHIEWTEEEEAIAREKTTENSSVKVQLEDQVKYESQASKYWNNFYKTHKNKFFKDRNWLLREFPEILPFGLHTKEEKGNLSWDHVKTNATDSFSKIDCPALLKGVESCKNDSVGDFAYSQSEISSGDNQHTKKKRREAAKIQLFPGSHAAFRILEVGCGAGNSVFPILNALKNAPETFLYCCDFASGAVELVKSHSAYSPAQCSAFVHDVCDDGLSYPFPDGILDVILLVFVLSSIHPDRMQGVVNRLSKLLRPGGMLLFRDHGRYDLTQLRFKKGCCLSENFYVRGDGTRAYFFTKGEVHDMFHQAGLDEKQNLIDRRLQVNRKEKVRMHRVWIQGKFQKPLHSFHNDSDDLIPGVSAG
ncbi:tRNA N(3)-methylcytidine methyltransferase METTL8, mitochondrial isoform X1 [Antechinus flavipes]|uniref:tRNA N(3)-methylcytidine methyltransferase METTL8, mitochondrial isoform X1 n=1 Tax=Antechinus flavipes TaxID=38775 RepID=UPI0022360463|nr:tRNA N(3)-methylcytidine methyltransferase METTL8, mitochondrial isoform X1 [Antechinus flavipes]